MAASPLEIVWLDAPAVYSRPALSPKEQSKTEKEQWARLTAGVRPHRASRASGDRPHAVVTIGAPGAGKSTVVPRVAAAREPGREYVVVDPEMWSALNPHLDFRVPDLAGAETGLSLGEQEMFIPNSGNLLERLTEKKYNIIISYFRIQFLNLMKLHAQGYRTTLVYVGAPLAVLQERVWARAHATALFFGDRARSDEFVAKALAKKSERAAWAALWADEFLVVRNDWPAAREATVTEVPPGPGPEGLDAWLARARKAIADASIAPAAPAMGGARAAERGIRRPGLRKVRFAPEVAAAPTRWVLTPQDPAHPSPDALASAKVQAIRDLTAGRTPQPGSRPCLYLAVGPVGVGALAVAAAVAAQAGDTVVLSFRDAVKYHPNFRGIHQIDDADGQPTGAAWMGMWHAALWQMAVFWGEVEFELLKAGFRVVSDWFGVRVVKSHLIAAKAAGAETTLVLVGAPLDLAIARGEAWAVGSGEFWGPNLATQRQGTVRSWESSQQFAWGGLLADAFIVAAVGSAAAPAAAAANAKKIAARRPREPLADWFAGVRPVIADAFGMAAAGSPGAKTAAARHPPLRVTYAEARSWLGPEACQN